MRSIAKLMKDWQFTGPDGVTAAVVLPHTWNAVDGQDGGNDYYRGTCYYAKSMKRDEFGSDPIVYMEFEGANSSAWLYVNGKEAGHHDGGYSTWRVNVTDLLAEDNEINTFVARRILESKGIIVEHAENGKRAVEMVEQNPEGYFDAIVMDIRMPVMSGLEAARQIRAMSRTDAQTVPIIAMTANAYEEDVSQSLAAGMNAHLAKPIEPQVILDTLAEYIGSKN